MPKYNFTSNIKCSNCESTVRKLLDTKKEIEKFAVDLEDVDRKVEIITVEGVEESAVINWVAEAGFRLKPKKNLLQKLFK